jgi:predicted nucleic acid-binding Zn ribbon protein
MAKNEKKRTRLTFTQLIFYGIAILAILSMVATTVITVF